jgi:Peptidase family M28
MSRVSMLSGAIYRAAFAPFAVALAIAAFSLASRPAPLTSTLAPDAFDGQQALAETRQLAAEYPDRRPGGAGDERLAAHVAGVIEGLGGSAGGGFTVRVARIAGQTSSGERSLQTVIAQRPGSTAESPIVILAHRDSTARGAAAQLSGTGVLLELARVFAARETRRTIVLVSTSGGSGGDAGASDLLAGSLPGPIDAAIVLGDLASATPPRSPLVDPYSDSYGEASDVLQRTLAGAISGETPLPPSAPSAIGQLAHLAFPLAAGEQGVLNAAGTPSVLVQVSGEREPAAGAPLSGERIEGLGRAVLGAVDALDAAPDIEAAPQTGIVLARQIVPVWALRLLILTLLIPPAAVLIDGLARARRRRQPLVRWVAWTLTFALPFYACALFALLLGAIGAIPAPAAPVLGSALGGGGEAVTAVLACALVLGLAWLAWPLLVRALGLAAPLDPAAEEARGTDAAGIAALLVLLPVACLTWVFDPYAALLIVPTLHLLLPIASPERRPRPLAGLGLIALALVPLGLLIAFYASELGYGPGAVAWSAVLLLAGGHVGALAAALWSVACGCLVALGRIALTPPADPLGDGPDDLGGEITIRGPRSYAGPGSLGGTESALRG